MFCVLWHTLLVCYEIISRFLIEKNDLEIFLQIVLQVALYYCLLVGYNMTEILLRNGIALI